MSNPAIEKYGWNAVPHCIADLLAQSESIGPAPDIDISLIHFPSSRLATSVYEYVKSELPIETFNHSMRVYFYGMAILQYHFPSWFSESLSETYFLSSMLHDIGTTEKSLNGTLMSFEYYGGFLSLQLLKSLGAPTEQAESVTETIIRHQELGDVGTHSRISALIQLATILDNMGAEPEVVSKATIKSVTTAYPRKKWSACFAATIRKENSLKPWAHTTALGERAFPEAVASNVLMEPYDDLQ